MGDYIQAGCKKDKRLLVLLAFGACIVLSRTLTLMPDQVSDDKDWRWIDMPGDVHQLHRFPWPIPRPDIQISTRQHFRIDEIHYPLSDGSAPESFFLTHKAGTMVRDGNSVQLSGHISPRLAFLLGMPFPINHADAAEIALLPGLGQVLAAHIIAYREQNGRITGERSLRAVSGIGRHLAARLLPLISFE